jgi:hypothetical protein
MSLFKWLFDEKSQRPSARRVAARAMVLSTVVCRAYLEREHYAGIHENADGVYALVNWLVESGLEREMELDEREFLGTPVGEASRQMAVNGFWRTEGLGVLAWALQRFDVPPYDQMTNPDAAQKSVGYLSPIQELDLRKSGVLRPAAEISRFSKHITIVSWRLRQFAIDRAGAVKLADFDVSGNQPVVVEEGTLTDENRIPGVGERMDFAAYLRNHPRFQEYWLDGLRLIDGDLAIGNQPIAHADPEAVSDCTSIAIERQIAAYWLGGDDQTYSKVNPSTILS